MATPAMNPAGASAPKSNRGKDQIQWSDDVWKALDQAVTDEMTRTRQLAKFLPMVYVEKKRTTVEADVVVVPPTQAEAQQLGITFDPSLSVDETQTSRIQEYFATFRLSVAQVEAEEHQEMQAASSAQSGQSSSSSSGPAASGQGTMSAPHRAGTAISLALRCANVLAQAEDLILLNGQNAAVNAPLFINQQVQALAGKNLATDLDTGLVNTSSVGDVGLSTAQLIPVHPVQLGTGGSPPRYAENTLNAVAQGFSQLQALAHYENYALVLHTIPFADLHEALATTLIEPVEPISNLVKAGIYGTGLMPPFVPVTPPYPPASALPTTPATGLPITVTPPGSTTSPIASLPGFLSLPAFVTPPSGKKQPAATILYTGILVSLSGNTMDYVRGMLDDSLDAMVTFNQKDQNEQYRFRVFERLALRLKDPTAVILLLFLDS